MSQGDSSLLLKFTRFISYTDPSFWHRLSQLKLEVDRLNENVRPIWGYYTNKKQERINHVFSVDATSFNQEPDESRLFGYGKIINKNTYEGYKEESKIEILKNEGAKFMEIIKESAIEKPALLNFFVILSFADLKQHVFYYKFLFLAPGFLSYNQIGDSRPLRQCFDDVQISKIINGHNELDNYNKGFFLINVNGGDVKVLTVKDGLSQIEKSEDWIFGFADPCYAENPGWPLRNYLAFICYHCNKILDSPLRVLCLRLKLTDGNWELVNSVLLNIKANMTEESWMRTTNKEDWVGWETNNKGQLASKITTLKSFLDPAKLAESSVYLNLELMKWQLLPDLDLLVVKESKCLLLGAGALGCAVARNLLSWGVQKITLVDYGNISHSNPVRQSLFKFEDVGKPKAETAAAALKEISPTVDAKGISFCIPMPGHPIGESVKDETERSIKILEDLIDEHDAVFLLMDSRESRWLPTLLAAAKSKLAINSALGFDSFLVMRHGLKVEKDRDSKNDKILMGSQLGCYFCNDITSPGNSSRSRTLDQQCTVTRPGISNIAAGLAVELFVSILQHPLRGQAPAECDPETDTVGLLGIIPHSVRGFLSQYKIILPATKAFTSCVACSSKVVNEYKENGINFLFTAIESKEYLEDLCGLKELMEDTIISEVMEYSDSEGDD